MTMIILDLMEYQLEVIGNDSLTEKQRAGKEEGRGEAEKERREGRRE